MHKKYDIISRYTHTHTRHLFPAHAINPLERERSNELSRWSLAIEQTRCSNSDKEAKYLLSLLSCSLLSCSVAPFVSTKLTSSTTQLRADAAISPSQLVTALLCEQLSSIAVNFNLRSIFTASAPSLGGGTPGGPPTLFNLGGITKTQSIYNTSMIEYLITLFNFTSIWKTNTKKIEIVFQVIQTSSHLSKRIYIQWLHRHHLPTTTISTISRPIATSSAKNSWLN